MATTFIKDTIRPGRAAETTLGYLVREIGQGASQTYVRGAGLKVGSAGNAGYLVEAASAVAAASLVAFALEAGANNAVVGAAFARCILAIPTVTQIYASLLASGGGNHTLATTDWLTQTDIDKAAILPDGSVGWFVSVATSSAAAQLIGLESDHVIRNMQTQKSGRLAAYADINARLLFTLTDAVCAIG